MGEHAWCCAYKICSEIYLRPPNETEDSYSYMSASEENNLEIKTVQSSAFKVLVEALKELLTECSFVVDETGLKLVTMDSSHVVLVHLKLDACKFEHFHCKKPTTLGINMLHLHKLIKTINSNDTLTLFQEDGDINHLGIRIENSDKNTRTTYKLNLLDLDNTNMQIPPIAFESMITLPSTDFMKLIRDMHSIGSQTVEIQNVNNHLIFNTRGDFCAQETVLSEGDGKSGGVPITQAGSMNAQGEIVQGVFSLKYLVMFTKCTNLCNTVALYLRNNYPLICQYMVASLGEIKLCIAPQCGS